jgi:hypothetical protein
VILAPIHNLLELNMKLLFSEMVMTPKICKNSCNSFQNVTRWLKTFKYTCPDECVCVCVFFFWVWNLVQMWKINLKREYLIFWEKKTIRWYTHKIIHPIITPIKTLIYLGSTTLRKICSTEKKVHRYRCSWWETSALWSELWSSLAAAADGRRVLCGANCEAA